ncbi:hypothetical protein SK128_014766, partial [Halocaridina rubra]
LDSNYGAWVPLFDQLLSDYQWSDGTMFYSTDLYPTFVTLSYGIVLIRLDTHHCQTYSPGNQWHFSPEEVNHITCGSVKSANYCVVFESLCRSSLRSELGINELYYKLGALEVFCDVFGVTRAKPWGIVKASLAYALFVKGSEDIQSLQTYSLVEHSRITK